MNDRHFFLVHRKILHDFAARELGDRDDVIGTLHRLFDEETECAAPRRGASSLMPQVIEVVDTDDVGPPGGERRDITEGMNKIRPLAPKLDGEYCLLPAIPDDPPQSDEGADDATEVLAGCHVEIGRALVDEHDVLVVVVRFGQRVNERRGVRLGAAYDAGNEVEQIERNQHLSNALSYAARGDRARG